MSIEREVREERYPKEVFLETVARFGNLRQKPKFPAVVRYVLSVTFEGYWDNGENHYEYDTREVQDKQCLGIILQQYTGAYSQMMYVYDHAAMRILNCHVNSDGLPIIERDKYGNNQNTRLEFSPNSNNLEILREFIDQVSQLEAGDKPTEKGYYDDVAPKSWSEA